MKAFPWVDLPLFFLEKYMRIPRPLTLTAFLLAGVLPTQFTLAGEGLVDRPAAKFSVSFFNKLAPQKRMRFAVAALAMRDAKLSNIAFSVHGRVKNFGPNTKLGRWVYANDFSMRRRGISFWMHLKQYYSPDHHSFTNFFSNWDGSVERGVSYQAGNSTPDCVISDKPFTGIRANDFLDMLGFRVDTAIYDTTLVAYMRNALRNKWQHYLAHAVTTAAGPNIVVRVSTGGLGASYLHYREYWLDANRGFMPMRYREVYRSQGKLVAMAKGRATVAKKISGVWVPIAVEQASQNLGLPGIRTVQTFQVKRFAIGTVTASNLHLVFPKGARLLDLIKMRSYYINSRGRFVPRPLYIPQSGKIVQPPASVGDGSRP